MAREKSYAVGIDLGTTASALAYTSLLDPKPQPALGTKQVGIEFMPTVVYIDPSGRKSIGQQALEKYESVGNSSGRFFRDFKLKMTDPDYKTQLRKAGLDAPYELAALIIYALKYYAEEYDLSYGESIKRAVVTHPANWRNEEKEALIRAARVAGIEHPILLKEPIAALYEVNRDSSLSSGEMQRIMIVDYGGGTCDVTICKIHPGSFLLTREPEILGEHTDNLGGRDIDAVIQQSFIRQFYEEHPDYPNNCLEKHKKKLLNEAKRHKERFVNRLRQSRALFDVDGEQEVYEFEVEHLYRNCSLQVRWTVDQFNKIILPEVRRIVNPITKTLQKAECKRKEIDKVILVGGSSLLPPVKSLVRDIFDPFEPKVCLPPQPRHAVVYGAAVFHYYERHPEQRDIDGRKRYAALRIGLEGGKTHILVQTNESLPILGRTWECKVADRTRFVDFLILEGEGEEIDSDQNTTYAHKRLRLEESVPKGTRIVIEYQVDRQDIFELRGYIKDRPECAETIVGRGSIPLSDIRKSQERLSLPLE